MPAALLGPWDRVINKQMRFCSHEPVKQHKYCACLSFMFLLWTLGSTPKYWLPSFGKHTMFGVLHTFLLAFGIFAYLTLSSFTPPFDVCFPHCFRLGRNAGDPGPKMLLIFTSPLHGSIRNPENILCCYLHDDGFCDESLLGSDVNLFLLLWSQVGN